MNCYQSICSSLKILFKKNIYMVSILFFRSINGIIIENDREDGLFMYLFIHYPKCSTCQKAKKWLEANQIEFVSRHIVEENPKAGELTKWITASGLPVKKFFNTSGMKYKELALRDKLPTMSQEEQIALLATDGMLVKRPILIGSDVLLIGFKEDQWAEKLL